MRTAKIGPDLRLENDRKSIATLSGVCSCLGDSEILKLIVFRASCFSFQTLCKYQTVLYLISALFKPLRFIGE